MPRAWRIRFRLVMLTAPVAIIIALLFPVRSRHRRHNLRLFLVAVAGSILLMGAISFMIGTCAIPLTSILALIRAKYWLIELLSGLLDSHRFFPNAVAKDCRMASLRAHRFTPLQIYLGKLSGVDGASRARDAMALDCCAARVGDLWWRTLRARSPFTEDRTMKQTLSEIRVHLGLLAIISCSISKFASAIAEIS